MNTRLPAYLSEHQVQLMKDYFEQNTISDGYPNCLVIESTNRCNLDCIMCPRGTMTRATGAMDSGLFKKIIDEAVGKVEFIYFHFFGEPLLTDHIFDFIEYASGKGITTAMSTNAVLLDARTAKKFLESKLGLLIVSIDSLNKDVYEKIRRNGDFEKVIANVEGFVEMFSNTKSTLSATIQMIEMADNRGEIETFLSRWNNVPGLNVLIKRLDNYAGQYENAAQPSGHNCQGANSKICAEPWKTMVIGWDGKVLPCHNDYNYKVVLGDLNSQSIPDVWNGSKMQEFRLMQLEGRQNENSLCCGCNIDNETIEHGVSLYSRFRSGRAELQTYYNKGLYDMESGPQGSFLWTRKEWELLMQDGQAPHRLLLINGNPEKRVVEMTVTLFGEFLGKCAFSDRIDITLEPPEKYKGQLLRYEFCLDADWCPVQNQGTSDNRRLGVVIEHM